MDLRDVSDLNRVAIIDNDDIDGSSLQDALQAEQIGSVFLKVNGLTSLPKRPFPNLSLVFLDLNLISTLPNDRDKASYTTACLSKVVAPNSFYVLVIWSTHTTSGLETEFRNILKDTDITPCVPPISIAKGDCKNANGKYSVSKINANIKKQFSSLKAQSLFFKWETVVSTQASTFTNDLVKNDNQRELSKKIHALAEAYAGKIYSQNLAKNALFTLNDALKGSLDAAIAGSDDLEDYDKRVYKKVARVSVDQKAQINTHLMVDPHNRLGSGCVFECASSCKLHPTTTKNVRDKKKIMIDLTPLCDAAQQKNVLNHYIHALLLPAEKINLLYDRPDFIYVFPNQFHLEGKSYYLVINLKSLEGTRKRQRPGSDEKVTMQAESGENVEVINKALHTDNASNILVKFRDPVVLDIQQKVSSYMSRFGHTYLS